MDFGRIVTLYHTLKYLKLYQVVYRCIFFIKSKLPKKKYNFDLRRPVGLINWESHIIKSCSLQNEYDFVFLNISHSFSEKIDWNYSEHGKLWTYNLNYFDFLNQRIIDDDTAILLMHDFIRNTDQLIDGIEPYPTSLRGINWIKYLSVKKVNDAIINRSLYNQYLRLSDNLEYHIMGNHLLENGFSLLFGAYYFRSPYFFEKAKKIMSYELDEQILEDGAHYELSPMYHQIILDRLLDCLYLVKNNSWNSDFGFSNFIELKAVKMLSWITEITFSNGNIPMVNDSTFGISPNTCSLTSYALSLDVEPKEIDLVSSGYRKFENDKYELFVDIGELGPSYQPGHAHADTFNFTLNVDGSEFIVDPGITTYNIGAQRDAERSTLSHNTVVLNNKNSSNVWHGFRVAQRANVTSVKDDDYQVTAIHNGYENLGSMHKRSFSTFKSEIMIVDEIGTTGEGKFNLHFHPNCHLFYDKSSSELIVNNSASISLEGSSLIRFENYDYSLGFNKSISATRVVVSFRNKLITKIKLK